MTAFLWPFSRYQLAGWGVTLRLNRRSGESATAISRRTKMTARSQIRIIAGRNENPT
jgi:hypothetical protein